MDLENSLGLLVCGGTVEDDLVVARAAAKAVAEQK